MVNNKSQQRNTKTKTILQSVFPFLVCVRSNFEAKIRHGRNNDRYYQLALGLLLILKRRKLITLESKHLVLWWTVIYVPKGVGRLLGVSVGTPVRYERWGTRLGTLVNMQRHSRGEKWIRQSAANKPKSNTPVVISIVIIHSWDLATEGYSHRAPPLQRWQASGTNPAPTAR